MTGELISVIQVFHQRIFKMGSIIRPTTDYIRQFFKGIEIAEVYPGLFQSSAIRWPSDETRVKDLGINVLIDLQGGFDPRMKFLDQYLYWPIEDKNELPSIDLLRDVAFFASRVLLRRRKVLVHCTAGYNRSGLVNAFILHSCFGYSGTDAIEMIRKARPGSLYNQTFVEFLERL